MPNIDNKLVKLGVDTYFNRVENYSTEKSLEVLRNALIEANNGSTKLNIKDIRDGKCNGLFSLVEVIVDRINEEGLHGDEFFVNFIEDRNMALGDSPVFHVTDDSLFAVAEISNGNQSVRRQRIEGGSDVTVKTVNYGVRIYEELDRVLSGRIDFNEFVDRVGRSFTRHDLDTAYMAWTEMIKSLQAPYKETGTFSEDKLLDLIDHVEASTGATAVIVGTRKALRKVTTAVVSDEAKSDMYNMGYYGKFNGTAMIVMKQRHKVNSKEFILPDDMIYVFAGDSKPVKRVTEGETTMLMGDPMKNQDLTQEFLMTKKSGTCIVIDRDFACYNISG